MPADTRKATRLNLDEVTALIEVNYPQLRADGRMYRVEKIGYRRATLRLSHDERNIRPGGTISGPTMFTLADVAVYVAILAELGEAGLLAVTINLNINFLSRPAPQDLLATARLIKLGRRLAVGDVEIHTQGQSQMVAHASATYSIPPEAMR